MFVFLAVNITNGTLLTQPTDKLIYDRVKLHQFYTPFYSNMTRQNR